MNTNLDLETIKQLNLYIQKAIKESRTPETISAVAQLVESMKD